MHKSNYHRLDLEALQVMQSLYQTRNTTRTAEQLGMSQPGVSRILAKLRVALNDPLMVKAPGGMMLTDRALALQGQLTDVMSQIDGFLAPPGFAASTASRVFRLTTTDYGALAIVPALMRKLSNEAPGISIEVLAFSADLFRQLSEGQTDLALYSDDPVPLPLRTRTLFSEGYTCIVGNRHPLAKAGEVSLPDFLKWPHALVSIFGGRSGVVDEALAKLGLERKISLWIPYFATAAAITATSEMILTLPTRAAEALMQTQALCSFAPPFPIPPFDYRLLWHDRSDVDLGHRWIRDSIAEVVSHRMG